MFTIYLGSKKFTGANQGFTHTLVDVKGVPIANDQMKSKIPFLGHNHIERLLPDGMQCCPNGFCLVNLCVVDLNNTIGIAGG
jgi:hypothetical protein